MRWLPEPLARRLALEAPELRRLVERLCSPRAPTRLAALEAVLGHLLVDGQLGPRAEEALAYLLALATSRQYPGAAALLTRVAYLAAAIDDPPRSLASAAGTDAERRAHDAMGAYAGALIELARASTDPPAARLAATLAGRHPGHDAAVEPVLIALTSGASDAEERARLLYSLTRIQAHRGAVFHRRIAEALAAPELTPEQLAVALALLAEDPPEPDRSRLLRIVASAPPDADDPSAFGRQLAARRPH